HHKSIDRLRRRGRRQETELVSDAFVSPEDDPSVTVARAAEGDSVRAALVSLPEEQRRAVEMTYFAGLTISEVASRTAVPIGTVKSRLRLALQRLRHSLGEAWTS